MQTFLSFFPLADWRQHDKGLPLMVSRQSTALISFSRQHRDRGKQTMSCSTHVECRFYLFQATVQLRRLQGSFGLTVLGVEDPADVAVGQRGVVVQAIVPNSSAAREPRIRCEHCKAIDGLVTTMNSVLRVPLLLFFIPASATRLSMPTATISSTKIMKEPVLCCGRRARL